MTNGITLLGDMALIKALKELDKKAQNQIARKACREGAKEIAREVKSTISVRSGQTRRAVKVRVAKRKKGGSALTFASAQATSGGDIPCSLRRVWLEDRQAWHPRTEARSWSAQNPLGLREQAASR